VIFNILFSRYLFDSFPKACHNTIAFTGRNGMVAIAKKKLLTILQVRQQLPGRADGMPSASTITRWIIAGVTSVNGEKVKLKATRCGWRWLIDPVDVDAFFAALGGEVTESTLRTPAERMRSSAAANKELDAVGA
jgi:hypothetical protein